MHFTLAQRIRQPISATALGTAYTSATQQWNRHSAVTACIFPQCAVTGFPTFMCTFYLIDCIRGRTETLFHSVIHWLWLWLWPMTLISELDIDRVNTNHYGKYLVSTQPVHRAPIAYPPNSAQLGGIPYHSAKLHLGPCNSVRMRPRTDRHTDAREHNTFLVVYDSREM